jgi:hypothetical protein
MASRLYFPTSPPLHQQWSSACEADATGSVLGTRADPLAAVSLTKSPGVMHAFPAQVLPNRDAFGRTFTEISFVIKVMGWPITHARGPPFCATLVVHTQ